MLQSRSRLRDLSCARPASPLSPRSTGPALRVSALSQARSQGWLKTGHLYLRCALGRSGRGIQKREGDGKSPIGRWPLRFVFYRPDRLRRPATALPCRPLSPCDGWCDTPSDRNYNRHVRLPYPARCETLWREDHVYDLVVVLGHNDSPPVAGLGSAIFMHVAKAGRAPTEGCVALDKNDLLRILQKLRPGSVVEIMA